MANDDSDQVQSLEVILHADDSCICICRFEYILSSEVVLHVEDYVFAYAKTSVHVDTW